MGRIPDLNGIIPEFTLGDRLRKAREHAGLDMRDLAAMIDIHRQTVARYESGDATPRRPVILSWSLATGVSLDWLTFGAVSTHVEESQRATDFSYSPDYSLSTPEISRISAH